MSLATRTGAKRKRDCAENYVRQLIDRIQEHAVTDMHLSFADLDKAVAASPSKALWKKLLNAIVASGETFEEVIFYRHDFGEESPLATALHAELGQALATLPHLHQLTLFLMQQQGSIPGMMTVFTPLRQIKVLSLHDNASALSTKDVTSISKAMDGLATLEHISICYGPTNSLANLFNALTAPDLPALVKLELQSHNTSRALTAQTVQAIADFIRSKPSLQELYFDKVLFASTSATQSLSHAMSESSITKLTSCCHHYDWPKTASVVASALRSPSLRECSLSGLMINTVTLAEMFSSALDESRLEILMLTGLHVELIGDNAAPTALAQAICQPHLRELELRGSSSSFRLALASQLKNASSLQVLRVCREWNKTEGLKELLISSSYCPSLTDLCMPTIAPWTCELDKAAASCLIHCRHMVRLQLGGYDNAFWNPQGQLYSSPALVQACREHLSIQVVQLIGHSWSNQLRAQIRRVTERNIFRSRFDTVAVDAMARPVVGKVLGRVANKPHLLFLALTSINHLLS